MCAGVILTWRGGRVVGQAARGVPLRSRGVEAFGALPPTPVRSRRHSEAVRCDGCVAPPRVHWGREIGSRAAAGWVCGGRFRVPTRSFGLGHFGCAAPVRDRADHAAPCLACAAGSVHTEPCMGRGRLRMAQSVHGGRLPGAKLLLRPQWPTVRSAVGSWCARRRCDANL